MIANRGEIALRIIRACKEMEITSIVVFSEPDSNGVWIKKADEAHQIKGDPIKAYLDYERIVDLALELNCDAIHPGYGFLSENSEFAALCEKKGIIFVGPKPDHIALFGDKMASKVAMQKVGVPVLMGTEEPITDLGVAKTIATQIGLPVIIKAAFGGGGRGMRIVHKAEEFEELFLAATTEAEKFFGKGDVFIEKYLQNPRHIEVQVAADKFGNVIHIGERDCSIQRRHQKVVEIAPSPSLNPKVRSALLRTSTRAMFKLGYESVGTVEFLVDRDDNFYFIEMNTRIQVEHPVSESISGLDLIKLMIRIAEGRELPVMQEDIKFRGYAIEFRINAEDPKNGFKPAPGRISAHYPPGGAGVRLDSIASKDYLIPAYYDSMIAKLIVTGSTWKDTVKKARRALDEYIVGGVPTNIVLHRQIVREEEFINGKFDTGYLDQKMPHFKLEAINEIEEEEQRLNNLSAAIMAAISAHIQNDEV